MSYEIPALHRTPLPRVRVTPVATGPATVPLRAVPDLETTNELQFTEDEGEVSYRGTAFELDNVTGGGRPAIGLLTVLALLAGTVAWFAPAPINLFALSIAAAAALVTARAYVSRRAQR